MKRSMRSVFASILAVMVVLSSVHISADTVAENDPRIKVTGFREFDVSEVNNARLSISLDKSIYLGGWTPKYWFSNSADFVYYEGTPFFNLADFDGSVYSIPLRNGSNGELSPGDWFLYVWSEKYTNKLNTTVPNVYKVQIRGNTSSSNAELKSLVIPGVSLMYDHNTSNYWANVPYDVTYIEIQAEAADANATVAGTGYYSLTEGQNYFYVTVMSEDGSAFSTHTIVLNRDNRMLSSDASLASLTVSDVLLSDDYETGGYRANIPYEIEYIEIMAKANDANATVTGTGTYYLDIGVNQFAVTVTAEDGVTTQIYPISLYRDKLLSGDTTLKDLKVSDADLVYISETDSYLAEVPNHISSVYITAEAANENAMVDGTGYHSLTEGRNEFIITVTAESGLTQTYAIVINREEYQASHNTQLKLLRVGDIDLSYDAQKDNYWALVPYETDRVNLTAEAEDSTAIVEGTGVHRLTVGTNVFTVTVTAEDRITVQTYTIIIYRENLALSANANLLSLEVRGIPLAYDEYKDLYWANVANEIEEIEILAVAADENATVAGDGYHGLNVGNNRLTVTVIAEDGYTTRTYTLSLRREAELSNNANLASLSLRDAELTYDPAMDVYWATVSYETSSIEIMADPEHENATVEGVGYKNLSVGDNQFTIQVTAENRITVRTYRLVLYRDNERSRNAKLKTLAVIGIPLAYSYASDEYWATVPYETSDIEIQAEAEHEKATVSGTGYYSLDVGDNLITVTVTAEDGTAQAYQIRLYRKSSLSNNANLESLSVRYLSLSYDYATEEYWVNVPNDIDEVEIIAIAEDERATVEGAGYKKLEEGRNQFTIMVTAEDVVTIQTYDLVLNRAGKLSDDTKLKSLTIPGLTLKYDSNTGEHWASVPYEINSIEILAETNHKDATVNGVGFYNLSVGRNEILITVTAENGVSTQVYPIILNRVDISQLSNDTRLKRLDIRYLTLYYNSDKNEYWVNVPNGISVIEIVTETEHPNATVIGAGFHDLYVGRNPFSITVTAEDGVTTYTYTVVVNRESPSYTESSDYRSNSTEEPSIPAPSDPIVEEPAAASDTETPATSSEPLAPTVAPSNMPSSPKGSVFTSTPLAPASTGQSSANRQNTLAPTASPQSTTMPLSPYIENQVPQLAPSRSPNQTPVAAGNGREVDYNPGGIYKPATELGNVAVAQDTIKTFWSQPTAPDGKAVPKIVDTIDLSPRAFRGNINDMVRDTGVVIGSISVICETNAKYDRFTTKIAEAGSYRVHLLISSNVGEPLYNSRTDGTIEYSIN